MKKGFYRFLFLPLFLAATQSSSALTTPPSDYFCYKIGKKYVPVNFTIKKGKKLGYKKITNRLAKEQCNSTVRDLSIFSSSSFSCALPIQRNVTINQGSSADITFPAKVGPFKLTVGNYKLDKAPEHGSVTPSAANNFRTSKYTPAAAFFGDDKFRVSAPIQIGIGGLQCVVHGKAEIKVRRSVPTPTPTATRTPVVRLEPVGASYAVEDSASKTITLKVNNRTDTTHCFITTQPQNGSLKTESTDGCKVTYTLNNQNATSDVLKFSAKDQGYTSPIVASINFTITRREFAGIRDSLDHYRNTLTEKEIKHLLRKTAYCGTPQLEEFAKTHTLDQTVDVLLNGFGSNGPVLAQADAIREANKGTQEFNIMEDGVPVKYTSVDNIRYTYAGTVFRTWHLLRYSTIPLQERMTLWLYNQLPVSLNGSIGTILSHWMIKEYEDSLRQEALGSYQRYLTKQNALGAMGIFLDNFFNDVKTGNPTHAYNLGQLNVNFSREFLELGALGKYDPITNQPNYTEADVKTMAIAARGFTRIASAPIPVMVRKVSDPTGPVIEHSYKVHQTLYDPTRWMPDPANPVATTFFPDRPYSKTDVFKMDSFSPNGDNVTPYLLYNHPGAARFIASRLYSSFVNPQPNEAIVSKLAEELKAARYELKPFLKRLFTSSMMFHKDAVRSGIASPAQMYTCMLRTFNLPLVAKDNTMGLNAAIKTASEQAGQTLWAYGSIFGLNEAGKNGDGVIHKGEDFLSPQQLLGRQQGITRYLNVLITAEKAGNVDFTWKQILPTDSRGVKITDPAAIIDAFAKKLDITLSAEEKSKILLYLTTAPTSGTGENPVTIQWDPTSPAFDNILRIKLSGLIVLFSQMIETNLM